MNKKTELCYKTLFTEIYENNVWGNDISTKFKGMSGSGSGKNNYFGRFLKKFL